MSFIKAKYQLEALVPGKPVVGRLGVVKPGVDEWVPFLVAQWWVHKTEEQGEDSVLRLIDLLTMHVPAENAPSAGGRVRLPDGSVWTVEANPEDYGHGWHGWNPGLVVVNCRKVTG